MKTRLSILAFSLCTSVALAEPTPAEGPAPVDHPNKAVSELVVEQLVAPLQKVERKRSKFSRAAPVALERRVRVLDAAALTDAHGKEYVRFAIDERRALGPDMPWQPDDMLGCAYLKEHEVFVKNGERFLPAGSVLGKTVRVQAGVCEPARHAQTAPVTVAAPSAFPAAKS